jgi:sterol desaturase/sphingolipid hydroxylase (fatty acid hydroxylase superfamily)
MFIQFFLHIFYYDIWFYISHILLHKYFYYIHKQHHYNLTPTFFDIYTAHWLESPIQMIGIFVPFLLGYIDYIPLICAAIYMNIRGILRHDNRGNFAFGNHHMLHHRYIQYNYGEYWIDYLFGTLYPNKKEYIFGFFY